MKVLVNFFARIQMDFAGISGKNNNMSKKGIFITLEGGEGTGKSTQAKLLVQALAASGIDAIATREPGGTPAAERIREVLVKNDTGRLEPLTEMLLLSAARNEHIVHKIRPALGQGQWVISDRFIDSTRAMQGAGMGLSRGMIEAVYGLISDGLAPDLTLVFDIDPTLGLKRSTKRLAAQSSGEDRYERMELAFHEKLRQGFLDIAKAEPERCAVIDASQPVEAVHAAVLRAVAERTGIETKEAAHG
jgi:dTMP kinase